MTTKRRSEGRQSTLHGLIVPASWVEGKGVVQVAINTYDEEEYFVHSDGLDLLPYIHQEVEVTGLVFESDDNLFISVEQVKVINS